MNASFRKSLLAGAIAALAASPVLAGGEYGTERTRPITQWGEGSTAGSPTAASGSQLHSMTPQELQGKQVVGANGEQLGEVASVVQSRAQNNIQLVVSTGGGMMGTGSEKQVAIPLNEFQVAGNELHLRATEQDLQARPEYSPQEFVALQPEDQPLSDFAAFEPMEGGAGMQQQGTGRNPILPGGGPEGRIRSLEERPGESIYD